MCYLFTKPRTIKTKKQQSPRKSGLWHVFPPLAARARQARGPLRHPRVNGNMMIIILVILIVLILVLVAITIVVIVIETTIVMIIEA